MSLAAINFASCTFGPTDQVMTFTITAIGPLDSTIQFGDIVQDSDDQLHFQCISTATENPGSSNGEDTWTATHTFEGNASDGNPHPTIHVRISYRERDTGKPAELEFDLKKGETASKGFEFGSTL